MNKIAKSGPIINPFKIVTRTIMRFYLVLFTVIVVGGLIVAVITLTEILTKPQLIKDTAVQQGSPTSQELVEQATRNRLSKLQVSSNNTLQDMVSSIRPNPFSE